MQEERNAASPRICGWKLALRRCHARKSPQPPFKGGRFRIGILVLLIGVQILFFTQEIPAQEITDIEVSNLQDQFSVIQQNLTSIDDRLASLNEELTSVTNEITTLKEELKRSGGVLGRFRNVFRNRKLGKLSTRSQDLWNEISKLERERGSRIKQFIMSADELIDKSGMYITVLMEAAREADLNNDIETRDKALKQVSTLWQQTEKTTAARNKYARAILDPRRTAELPPTMSSDPRELRLFATILRNAASEAQGEIAELDKEIKDQEQKKRVLERMLELSRDIKRSSEERGSGDIGFGTPDIPWGSERDIEEIEQSIIELTERKQNFEADAERYKAQSKALEWQASQIEAKLKGKSEDD